MINVEAHAAHLSDGKRKIIYLCMYLKAYINFTPTYTTYDILTCARVSPAPPDNRCVCKRRYPDGAATHAVKIVVAKETSAAAAPVEDLEEEQGAIAWCALHGRAAASAEDELAAELLARDSKVRDPDCWM